MPDPFADRTYRREHRGRGLVYYRLTVGESDLHIGAARKDEDTARSALIAARGEITDAIAHCPAFMTSLEPIETLPVFSPIAACMCAAATAAGVGPMAAVAGALAQAVGRKLSGEVVVENGGDLYIRCETTRVAAINAASSPLTGKLGVSLEPGEYGLATSSGTVGHSLSFGCADAAVVLSGDALLADAAATALGNLIQRAEDLEHAAARIARIPGVMGAMAIVGDKLAITGDINVVLL